MNPNPNPNPNSWPPPDTSDTSTVTQLFELSDSDKEDFKNIAEGEDSVVFKAANGDLKTAKVVTKDSDNFTLRVWPEYANMKGEVTTEDSEPLVISFKDVRSIEKPAN